ncbi:MAG: PAS domain S-box protein [Rhodoferax sp.]|uniref:two-component system sensor histidine kinase NtrB n=1 Tax=Rhodoferax sp. TaxID=50421 RepID=UPI00262A462C|nr:PAS domain S-box protein [Rhodoferax sp.]MDD5332844.1 PAS domain S-box protein [Rhodoferax sp.]
MPEKATSRSSTVRRVYLIVALFVALIFGLVWLVQIQMDTLSAIRAFVGGEGLWAKAQKEAMHSLEHYAVSHDEAQYQAYQQLIQVPLGDRRARIELQKANPDSAITMQGFVQGRNHPDDHDAAVRLFRRFQHGAALSHVVEHWTTGDRLIAELNQVAEALHEEIASGRKQPEAIRSYLGRLDDINRRVTLEEDQFSSALGEASRWVKDFSRNLTYVIALLFVTLGVGVSWSIITRIRATETALSGSEERLRSIFEHVDDTIYLVALDGTFISLSPSFERLTGWQPREWVGKPFVQIIHPDDLPRALEVFQKALAGRPTPAFELRVARKSGGYFHSELSIVPVTPGGETAAIGIARDITQRKLVEEKIQRLNEELEAKVQQRTRQLLEAQEELVRKEKLAVLGQVAGSVGHELRNPLGVMSNAVFFLQTVLADADDSTREYLSIIKEEIASSERIVSDLLDAVRTKPAQPELVAVSELLAQTLHKLVVPASVSVKLDIPAALPPLRADPMQIQQVLRNLIGNALEAMPDGGTLELGAAENRPAGSVAISVRDSGTGMTPEVLAKLFQPLFTTKARGIGLGLVVVKNLVQANGGSVQVASVAGKGSLFTVTLPSARSEGEIA